MKCMKENSKFDHSNAQINYAGLIDAYSMIE